MRTQNEQDTAHILSRGAAVLVLKNRKGVGLFLLQSSPSVRSHSLIFELAVLQTKASVVRYHGHPRKRWALWSLQVHPLERCHFGSVFFPRQEVANTEGRGRQDVITDRAWICTITQLVAIAVQSGQACVEDGELVLG